MLAMSRPDALMLGVSGRDAAANAARFTAARHVYEDQKRFDASVYARATRQRTMVDPDPVRPFGLDALLHARGDVQAVVDDPGFAHSVLDDMRRGYREEIISDEDGTRYESFGPTPAEEAEGAYQAALIHEELADRGVVASRAVARTPVHDALVGYQLRDMKHDPDFIQHRIETRERLNDLIRQHRGDELARVLQEERFVPQAGDWIHDRFEAPVPVPHSYKGQELRDAIEAADELTKELIDNAVVDVAQAVLAGELIADFPGSVDSRYSGVWKIGLGSREPDVEADQADIDGDIDATWHFSSDGFMHIIDSGLRLDAPPHQVAAWIVDQARQAGSPRQTDWDARIRASDPFRRAPGRSPNTPLRGQPEAPEPPGLSPSPGRRPAGPGIF